MIAPKRMNKAQLLDENETLRFELKELREEKQSPRQFLNTSEEVLQTAKKLGLFKFNKFLSQYEIIVPLSDYEKL